GKREGARPGAKGQSRGDVHVMTERDPVRDVPMCAGPGTAGRMTPVLAWSAHLTEPGQTLLRCARFYRVGPRGRGDGSRRGGGSSGRGPGWPGAGRWGPGG